MRNLTAKQVAEVESFLRNPAEWAKVTGGWSQKQIDQFNDQIRIYVLTRAKDNAQDLEDKAIWTAIHHYQSEAKNGATWAGSIADGLVRVWAKMKKYNEILEFIQIPVERR